MLKTISTDLDELMAVVTQKDCTELKKLIMENPEAPLLIFAGEEAYHDEYAYECAVEGSVSLEEVTLYDGQWWLSREDYKETLYNDMSDDELYENLSGNEFDAEVEKIISETAFIKAIVVYVG